MEKEFFEILTIGEQVEIINNLDGPKETGEKIGADKKTEGKTLSRENFKDHRKQKFFKVKNHIKKENEKQISDMDIDAVIIQKLKNTINLDELSSEKLTSSINIDELSNQRLTSAINMEELSSQKLTNAINIEHLTNKNLTNSTNINEDEIKKISQNIIELKEMINNLKHQNTSNNQESTNIMHSFKNLPKTIEILERTFKINLEVAKNFDEFYEDNKEFRVQDLISLALQELIDKYK